MKAYFFQKGVGRLAKEINGNENIYLGIRPYGFHAGNMLPFIIYPMLLCKEMVKLGKIPKFSIYIFINDWEQDKLNGPDLIKYPYNIFPWNTTFQYTKYDRSTNKSIVDVWEPIIFKETLHLKSLYPQVAIQTVRNSELKNNEIMKRYVLFTLENPRKIAEVIEQFSNKMILKDPLSFAIAVCPVCHKVKGKTHVVNKSLIHNCFHCGKTIKGLYEDFDYWFYHKPLAIPRLEIFDIDICITGLDHYNEGDFDIRHELIKLFKSSTKFPKTLYAQTLLGSDNHVMGKSRGNSRVVSIDKLMELFNKNSNSKTMIIQ